MQVEVLNSFIEDKPAFLVEASGFYRVYQAVNIYEMKAYLMRCYPWISFPSVCEIPSHLRSYYSCIIFNLVSK